MPASSLLASACDLDITTEQAGGDFGRGSHLSSLSCDSVRIYRSTSAVNVRREKVDSHVAATDSVSDRSDSPTTTFPKLTVTEPTCAIRYGYVPTDPENTDQHTASDSKVQWTTTGGQEDAVETTLLGGTVNLPPVGQLFTPDPRQRKPFYKWVQALNRRHIARRRLRRLDTSDQARSDMSNRATGSSVSRRNSSSISSLAYVSAIRDASISGASTSFEASSRKLRARSPKRLSKTDRSSRASYSARLSEDDRPQTQADLATLERSKHRCRILEELIETEEGYIGDIKFLMKAYLTIFAPSTSVDPGFRLSMHSNLTDIVELHDQILGDLHRVVPNSEYAGVPPMGFSYSSPTSRIQRGRSLDVVSEDKTEGLQLYGFSGLAAEPHTAAAAANIFTKIAGRFFIYEEYGAKYGMVIDDLKKMHRLNPQWDRHQRGLEALASFLSYSRGPSGSKRSLSIDDLLAKPIQRVCRYPLLFKELLKATPVYDCPHSHSEIEKAFDKLENVARSMNEAADDPLIKSTLRKTWVLQERLQFPSKATSGACKSRVRSFGRIELCGVLHVCWQTESSVEGGYMIGILYRDWLCLAVADKAEKTYTLRACLPLGNCSLEEADNGRGLQCHSAPYSWKIAFECNSQLYEILLTAGNQTEEHEWRRRLDRHATNGSSPMSENASFEFLDLKIRSLGTVFKKPDALARKPSIRRLTTMPLARTQMCQVILNNTCIGKEPAKAESKHTASINRSKSLQVSSRIPVLAPSRGDRAHLESLISDVWTRDILFRAGLAARPRGGHHRRPSASSIMRKISVVSLTGTFGRRSTSRTSSYKAVDGAEHDTPRQAAPPLLPEIDLATKEGLGCKLLNDYSKAGHIEVTVHERTSSDVSTSFDRQGEHSYFLAGTTEKMGYSLQQKRNQPGSTAAAADIPRFSVTRFVEEMGPRKANSVGDTDGDAHKTSLMSPSLPDLCHNEASSESTADMSVSSSTVKMMASLTQQPGRTHSTKQAKHWLGRPLLHRRSLRRSAKEMHH